MSQAREEAVLAAWKVALSLICGVIWLAGIVYWG